MTVVRSDGAGSVIEVLVQPGDPVSHGDEMVVMESMKMEVPVISPQAGIVEGVHVGVGETVREDDVIVTITVTAEEDAS